MTAPKRLYDICFNSGDDGNKEELLDLPEDEDMMWPVITPAIRSALYDRKSIHRILGYPYIKSDIYPNRPIVWRKGYWGRKIVPSSRIKNNNERLNSTSEEMITEYIANIIRMPEDALDKTPNIGLMTNMCIKMIDSLFMNMSNNYMRRDEYKQTKPYEQHTPFSWEYVLNHAKLIGIPHEVILNAQKKMEEETGRRLEGLRHISVEESILDRLNKGDFNMSSEWVRTKQKYHDKKRKRVMDSYEQPQEGDICEHVRWLLDLSLQTPSEQKETLLAEKNEYITLDT